MRAAGSVGCFVLLTVLSLTSRGLGAVGDWTVVFRADDSALWRHGAGDASAENGFAMSAEKMPEKPTFVRMKRMDTGDYVIIAMKQKLDSTGTVDGDLHWTGNASVRHGATASNVLLGISRGSWPTTQKSDELVQRAQGRMDSGYRGWGFSKSAFPSQAQNWSWAGQPIDKTVFEIAVKTTDLNDDEKKHLLDPAPPPGAATAPAIAEQSDSAATQPSRLQSSIHTLYVMEQGSGGMLGGASELILTATRGKAGDRLPVDFTTEAGHDMHLVLDDVVRAIDVKYPKVSVSKVELSFADKYTPKDGGSIGAACGTLILSMIEGFEIDSKLAITGDVTAEGKIRRIGGVAAKIRGATGVGCHVMVVPSENYDQVVDAMVYEGLPLLSNIEVIGADNLDQAAAVARTDRPDKLAKAMALFAEVQADLKKSATRLHTKEVRDKLATAADLAPNDYSVKLLLLASQDKQPKRLSATATAYYTSVAINGVAPLLMDRSQAIDKSKIHSDAVAAAIRKIDKARRLGDPKLLPFVDASRELIKSLNDFETGVGSVNQLQSARDKFLDAYNKLDTDRDLMEKMNKEGI